MSESLPIMCQKSPYRVDIEAGKTYWWCACGKSAKQPYCDGSHKGSGFAPVKFEATQNESFPFCGCKKTGKAPRCDGTHRSL
jgi:CDGSH-type Zn-finger protein